MRGDSSRLSTKAHRRSKKRHKQKLKKESTIKAMAAKLPDFTKLTDVTSWNSLNLFGWPTSTKSNYRYEEDFGVRYEEDFCVEMDEDISLRITYDLNRV